MQYFSNLELMFWGFFFCSNYEEMGGGGADTGRAKLPFQDFEYHVSQTVILYG